MNDEILAALDELIDVNEHYTLSRDERTRALRERVAVMPVYYQPNDWEWCLRHGAPIRKVRGIQRCRCYGARNGEPGKCVRVPLYVEAPDP